MPNPKIDVSKIRAEIDSKKKQIMEQNVASGKPMGPVSSMSFLRGLQQAVQTGNASSPVIQQMKIVENKAHEMAPAKVKPPRVLDSSMASLVGNETPQPRQRLQERAAPQGDYEAHAEEREEALYSRMTSQGNRSQVNNLVEEFYGRPQQQQAAPQQQMPIGGGMRLNEQAINDALDQKFTNYVADSVGPIMEAAMKNTIIELYSKERVKKMLVEMDLKAMVKEMVHEAIKELQERNKKAKA